MVTGLWYTYDPTFGSLSCFWYRSKFWLFILILRVKRIPMSSKSSFGAFEGTGGSWLGLGNLILFLIWSLVFDTTMIQILAFYLDFKRAKKIDFLEVLIWGFGWCWRFLTGVWNLHLDLDMVRNFAWIFSKALITIISVEAWIQSV